MARRMTIVFDDEALYTRLKVEAAFNHRPAKDIVADALRLPFATQEAGYPTGRSPAVATRVPDIYREHESVRP
jgi:hypothetical protein